jgi:hypothetical protein
MPCNAAAPDCCAEQVCRCGHGVWCLVRARAGTVSRAYSEYPVTRQHCYVAKSLQHPSRAPHVLITGQCRWSVIVCRGCKLCYVAIPVLLLAVCRLWNLLCVGWAARWATLLQLTRSETCRIVRTVWGVKRCTVSSSCVSLIASMSPARSIRPALAFVFTVLVISAVGFTIQS